MVKLADSATYNLPYRRRRKGRTDYKKRWALVVSGIPRLVTRPSNKNMIVQVIEAKPEGDRVITSASSMEIAAKYGWKGGCGNLPTAYLTGFLAGFRAAEKKVSKVILDIGLRHATLGSRVFAALKGALDAGLSIPHGEEALPNEERLKGEHISSYASELSKETDVYKRAFSKYLREGLKPEDLPIHFEEVKKRIMKKKGKGLFLGVIFNPIFFCSSI